MSMRIPRSGSESTTLRFPYYFLCSSFVYSIFTLENYCREALKYEGTHR
jgi:hypothetical protein